MAIILVGGWACPSKKYELVNWDDKIPTIWKHKKNVPNHQPQISYGFVCLLINSFEDHLDDTWWNPWSLHQIRRVPYRCSFNLTMGIEGFWRQVFSISNSNKRSQKRIPKNESFHRISDSFNRKKRWSYKVHLTSLFFINWPYFSFYLSNLSSGHFT